MQRRRIAGTLPRTSRVMSPASTIVRTAAWRVNRLAGWRHSGFEIGAGWHRTSRPSVERCLATRLDDRTRQGVRHACTGFRCETGEDNLPAQRPAARRPVSKGAGSGRSYKWSWGAGPDQAYRIGPAGLSAGPRLPHPGSARRSSGIMWASACRRMSEPAWRSMAHQSSTLYVVATLPLARS